MSLGCKALEYGVQDLGFAHGVAFFPVLLAEGSYMSSGVREVFGGYSGHAEVFGIFPMNCFGVGGLRYHEACIQL